MDRVRLVRNYIRIINRGLLGLIMFKRAGIPELVRSHQKDEFYLHYHRSSVTDIVQILAGSKRWISWRHEIDVLADLVYFILTTFSGLQTIGEEYVNIIQVDKTLRSLPSQWKRILMVTLHVLSPYALRKAIEKLEWYLQTSSLDVREESRQFLLQTVPVLKHIITILHRSHLAVFYINGIFYHLAKRIFGVHYIQYMPKQDNFKSKTFKILGWLSLVQLAGSLVLQLYTLKKLHQKTFGQEDKPVLPNRSRKNSLSIVPPIQKCSLCLELRKNTTSTPCGHLFCWACIHEWCQTKAECPLCREQSPPHSLVCLMNYDPS